MLAPQARTSNTHEGHRCSSLHHVCINRSLQASQALFQPGDVVPDQPHRVIQPFRIAQQQIQQKSCQQREEELASLENLDADLEELSRQSKKALEALQATALKLSSSRIQAAERYDQAVSDILHTLGMPKAIFTTSITTQALSPNGADKIEFTLAPNPGEGFKSLQKAVSGGELSRVLLSIKSVMADLDHVPLLIFDEVDSGISGEVGNSIGEALKNLGKHHQILTITHLHQVASRAVNQLAVSKEEIDGRTYTHVKELDREGRINEISRMLGGESDTVREHARQLLEA